MSALIQGGAFLASPTRTAQPRASGRNPAGIPSWLFQPDTRQFAEISRWQVPGLHYPCWAAPVLADKRVYLRSEDRLVCLNFARR